MATQDEIEIEALIEKRRSQTYGSRSGSKMDGLSLELLISDMKKAKNYEKSLLITQHRLAAFYRLGLGSFATEEEEEIQFGD